MRMVFMGSAPLACLPLEVLASHRDTEIVTVVTQPDRPKGRRLRTAACPAKARASSLGVPIFAPENVNDPDSIDAIREMSPELVVVVAYGQILSAPLLNVPAHGCVNVHASLLPKYRGAAPIQWAIARGEKVTGVTTMFMNERMDAGDIISQSEVPIDQGDTAGSLHEKLAEAGARLLLETVAAVRTGNAPRVAQVESEATLAPKLKKAHGRIDWTLSAREIYNRVRGFNPWPVCWSELGGSSPVRSPGRGTRKDGGSLRVLKVRVEEAQGRPGEVVGVSGDGPVVATGRQAVCLLEVQPEGGRVMSGAAYLRGHGLAIGDELTLQGR